MEMAMVMNDDADGNGEMNTPTLSATAEAPATSGATLAEAEAAAARIKVPNVSNRFNTGLDFRRLTNPDESAMLIHSSGTESLEIISQFPCDSTVVLRSASATLVS